MQESSSVWFFSSNYQASYCQNKQPKTAPNIQSLRNTTSQPAHPIKFLQIQDSQPAWCPQVAHVPTNRDLSVCHFYKQFKVLWRGRLIPRHHNTNKPHRALLTLMIAGGRGRAHVCVNTHLLQHHILSSHHCNTHLTSLSTSLNSLSAHMLSSTSLYHSICLRRCVCGTFSTANEKVKQFVCSWGLRSTWK